ncbi:unnamed protein product, partial [Sphagnum compactum]
MSEPEDKPSDNELIDPIEGLLQLEKLISEAKEYDSKQKVSFNGNKMLNDLLDKPIGLKTDDKSDDENVSDEELTNEQLANEELDNEELPEEDETELIDEALDEEAEKEEQRGVKRSNDVEDESEEESEEEKAAEEKKTTDNPKTKKNKRLKSPKKKGKRSSNPTLRKNIKSILKEKDLDKETQLARKEEEERIARQRERSQQRWHELQAKQKDSLFGPFSSLNSTPICSNSNDSSDHRFDEITDEVLLSSDDDDDHKSSSSSSLLRQMPASDKLSTEVIDLSSSDDESYANNQRSDFCNSGIKLDYNMTGAYDDDDVAIIDNNNTESDTNLEDVISFVDIFLSEHTGAKYVLCIVPINTLQNWISEFNMWLPDETSTIDKYFKKTETNDEIKYRKFKVFAISEAKSMTARAKEILSWRKFGGVLLLGYEMYRILTSVNNRNKSKKDEDIDPKILDQINSEVRAALIDPGPDLVVCDEGHRIKNCNAATSQALKNIKTKRRIVLTGYPLQNKLLEYWCMVDFVRPNYLGLKSEFTNMFERPIINGQCIDSTPYDRKIMKFRAHVLYQLLKGFVQRRSHSVLQKALPAKCEYVLMCRMTKSQKDLMLAFLDTAINDPDAIGTSKGRISTLTLFAVCCKIWNHPDIIYDIVRKGISSDDLDIDIPTKNKTQTKNNRKKKVPNGSCSSGEPIDEKTINPFNVIPNNLFDTPLRNQKSEGVLDFTWAEPKMFDYTPGLIENSYKMVLLFEIIAESLALGDRLLVFSQSLLTLDVIERFLQSKEVPKTRTKWCKNQTYYRLDGSTSTHERERYINLFNNTNTAQLFLISTRAGSLGINLIGANRIVIFDASWNPCHDAQAACRIYRYGQPKPCYIYRLVCDNSLEKKIYDRQVNKQGMANRVVDEQNVEANFTWREIHSLLDDLHEIKEPPIEVYGEQHLTKFSDQLIKNICMKFNQTIIRLPFEHESLLLDRKEQKLSSAEKRMAFGHYNEAKRMKGQHLDYSAAYAAMRNHMNSQRTLSPSSYSMPYNMPYPMASHSQLPSQMTPTPHYFPNDMSSYPDVSQPLPAFPPQARGLGPNQFMNFESIAETL